MPFINLKKFLSIPSFLVVFSQGRLLNLIIFFVYRDDQMFFLFFSLLYGELTLMFLMLIPFVFLE